MIPLILATAYTFIAVCVGAAFWQRTRSTWTHGKLSSHIARAVLLTLVLGALWPAALLVVWAYSYPSGRKIIDRYLFGSSTTDGL